MSALAPSEQHRAADLARDAMLSPRLAARLAARLVALEAVFKDARRNRYLMNAPSVRPLIDRAHTIMEQT